MCPFYKKTTVLPSLCKEEAELYSLTLRTEPVDWEIITNLKAGEVTAAIKAGIVVEDDYY